MAASSVAAKGPGDNEHVMLASSSGDDEGAEKGKAR